jgi:GLPGLI family protein
MKFTLITLTAVLFTGNMLFAQNTHFTKSGIISYDKQVNTYALIKKMLTLEGADNNAFAEQAFEAYKKTNTQFKTVKSTLTFGNDKTLFTPIPPENNSANFFGLPMTEQSNTIFSDLENNTMVEQKSVFEETFLIKDNLRNIKWKITDETRDILGYPCTRAYGLMLDSIYVVAFYTDKIPVSGGPESFGGLPGMILQVALPHENVSWVANKVTEEPVTDAAMVQPKKGKVVSNVQLSDVLKTLFKNRGDAKQVNYIMKTYLL